ncbi:choline/carnitine/betaine transport [Saccharopolyspora antimicrobica]|uniref:Choline/carnitine/betaine transport n=2 Tax=Saccharopolyspora antimicrobica TaxID=455193 RepID=A0A1I5ESZ0_9PSEU|nr:choline/carnitine/betaine transport [Saccharopolyspora antimicrobica]SFO14559.1 choline/carnitine/betaine transport [Saccharopolyspora antimicrobica]
MIRLRIGHEEALIMTRKASEPDKARPDIPRSPEAFAAAHRTDLLVFGVTAVITVVFVGWGVISTESLAVVSSSLLSWLVTNIGWGFVLASTGFVVFALWLAFSRYGAIPLGKDDEEPEFRTVSWIAMMFSAGMGIGLMFFGVAEPLAHFVEPPPGTVAPLSDAAVETAMATSLFHWTLHPWAIYAVVGLSIAYCSFRRGRKQLISAVFTPLIGKRGAEGPIGKLIDILALFATLFGSAASLGLGTLQIRSGMQAAGWIGAVGNTVLVLIIVVLTVCFIASAVSGVSKGIQWLSNINMVLAAVLAVFVFVAGPTVFILDLLPTTIGVYLRDFGEMASRSGATGGAAMNDWLSSWTIFYWAWWISWTPFVGMFIARISRGRTIRQFVGGVILVPSVVSLVWFAIFGGTSINVQQRGIDVYRSGGEEAQTFRVLETLPLSTLTTILVMVLVAIFFVSGADAASVVMGTLSQRGSIDPKRWMVVFWGAATGAVAAIMLIVGGEDALSGIQNLTFLASAPFAVVMVLLCVALLKDLREDPMMQREEKGAQVLEQAVIAGTERHGDFQLEVGPVEDDPDDESR